MKAQRFWVVMGVAGAMGVLFLGATTVIAPESVNAAATCGTTAVLSKPANSIPGLHITPGQNTVDGNGVNTLIFHIKNTRTTASTLTIQKFSSRCKEHLGYPFRSGTGQCQYYWDPNAANPNGNTQSVFENITLQPGQTKSIWVSVTQYNNAVCGSTQLDFNLVRYNGQPMNVQFGASFTDMCQDCNVTPPPVPTLDCPGNLITNGDFESPIISNPYNNNLWQVYGGAAVPGRYDSQPPILGWDPVSPYQVELQANGLFGAAASGRQYAEIDGGMGTKYLRQAVSTVSGATYKLKLAYAPRPDVGWQSMNVYWNNQAIASLSGSGNAGGIAWQQKEYTLTGSGTNTLAFGDGSPQGAGNFIDAVCLQRVSGPIRCTQNLDCGTPTTGGPFCQGNAVYRNVTTPTCFNHGTEQSRCENVTVAQLQNQCNQNQTCSDGQCHNIISDISAACSASPNPANVNQSVTFSTNNVTGGNGSYTYSWTNDCVGSGSTCTTSFASGGNKSAHVRITSGSKVKDLDCPVTVSTPEVLTASCYASPNAINVNQSTTFYSSNVSGGVGNYTYSWSGACTGSGSNCSTTLNQTGSQTAYLRVTSGNQYRDTSCSVFVTSGGTTCTSHSYQQCWNSGLYWFDSCGNRQDYIRACDQGNASVTLVKQVRNLSAANLTWASSVNASPSDILEFQVTIRATGNQNITNLTIRDILPANLLYKDALLIDGVATIGSIPLGLNIGGITQNQTRTVTYQTQVAPAQNFAFGTTTLTNSVTAASTDSGFATPSAASASVIVTRTGVQGATDVPTGLTNNFWVDSFFLPLMLLLLGIWLFRSKLVQAPAWTGIGKLRNSISARRLHDKIAEIRRNEQFKI